ncbi:hypothetical protein BJ138DRAFT_1106536 [Hygrophoropsis aurantiaca]|uniref:Uncharacterized protein n=1 Tax=Hygrophoropsis aurantiaca TaxID=72124 RepID=A0ACB7ZVM4_9AGAM|nr:hypothetical protein BJ138DRAFT_1106536 [Hygrophoropsis aurantiaca]
MRDGARWLRQRAMRHLAGDGNDSDKNQDPESRSGGNSGNSPSPTLTNEASASTEIVEDSLEAGEPEEQREPEITHEREGELVRPEMSEVMEETDQFPSWLHVMHEAKAPEEREYRYTIRKPTAMGKRPRRDACAQQCMAGPQVTKVVKLPVFQLENPVTLQLGCVGSQSKIFYGCNVKAEYGPLKVDHYFDVTNIDRYE